MRSASRFGSLVLVSNSFSTVQRLVSKYHYQRVLWAIYNAEEMCSRRRWSTEYLGTVEGTIKPKWTDY